MGDILRPSKNCFLSYISICVRERGIFISKNQAYLTYKDICENKTFFVRLNMKTVICNFTNFAHIHPMAIKTLFLVRQPPLYVQQLHPFHLPLSLQRSPHLLHLSQILLPIITNSYHHLPIEKPSKKQKNPRGVVRINVCSP